MAAIDALCCAGNGRPDVNRRVVSGGGERVSGGRPGYGVDRGAVGAIGEENAAVRRVQYLDQRVEAAAGDAQTVGRPGRGKDPVLFFMRIEQMPVERLPDLDGAVSVFSARSDGATVGRPGDAAHETYVPAIGEERLARACLPHAHAASRIARCNVASIGRPGQGKQIRVVLA